MKFGCRHFCMEHKKGLALRLTLEDENNIPFGILSAYPCFGGSLSRLYCGGIFVKLLT